MKTHFKLLCVYCLSLRVNGSCGECMFFAFAICRQAPEFILRQEKELSGLQGTGQRWQCHYWRSICSKVCMENSVFASRSAKSKLSPTNSPTLNPLDSFIQQWQRSHVKSLHVFIKEWLAFPEGLRFYSTLWKGCKCELVPQGRQKVLIWASWMPWF